MQWQNDYQGKNEETGGGGAFLSSRFVHHEITRNRARGSAVRSHHMSYASTCYYFTKPQEYYSCYLPPPHWDVNLLSD